MAVGMLLEVPGGTQEMYDSFNREMDMNPDTLPEGLISHYAGPTDGGWLVFDIWESEDAFNRFAQERLMPAAERVTGGEGPPMQPRFVPVYNELQARARV
jgi:hypothetical protein